MTSRSLSLASPAPAATSTTTPPPSSSTSTPAADRRLPTLLALLAVYVVWGSTYLVMRIAVETLPPMLMGAIRFTIAGGVLLAWAGARGAAWPTARQWLGALPVGALLFVGGNGFVAIAEKEVSSGLAAVVCATMPLWMAIFASVTGERPSRREWLGVGLGLGGVVVLVAGSEMAAAPLAAAILCASPLAWALGSLLSRRLALAPGLMAAASQQLAGGLALAVVGLARGERLPPVSAVTFDTVWTVAYLIVFGSLIAFSAYAWLLRNTRPAVATSYAFVNPALAVLLGVVLGAEQVGVATVIATPLIIAAVVLVVGRKR
ncbi:MAG TPA: drug/metabolite exporter YedA [Kofleriaceae bacterium]|nr:drug/metabolite exporter YedA [Kofleriaceae bacterium]